MKRSANKRANALKQLLENQIDQNIKEGSECTISTANSAMELPDSDSKKLQQPSLTQTIQFGVDEAKDKTRPDQKIAESIELFKMLIDKELLKAADEQGIEVSELKAWIDLQIEVPGKTILSLLRMMQSLHLDPLSEEIGFTQYEDGSWQVIVTIEGCAKLLNQHSQFNGLIFNQANTFIDGIPEWIECSIYRKDRAIPTTVREYLMEVRGESAIWQKMPRRMLRHRALQQCVRLAIS